MTVDLTNPNAPQPLKVTVTRYRCPFCRRQNSSKKHIVEHIERCWHNPANRTCRTCVHHVPAHMDGTTVPGLAHICSEADEHCRLDVDLPENAPVIDCPLWTLKEGVR